MTEITTIVAPAVIAVRVACPGCGELYVIPVHLGSRLVRDHDGAGTVAVRARASKVEHLCGQMPLELAPPTPIARAR